MDPLFDPADFRIPSGVAHVCAAGETPFLRRHDAAFIAYAEDKSGGSPGRTRQEARLASARDRAARLFGVAPGDIGFVSSVAEGVSMVVESIDWRAGDEVLVDPDEYPSVAAPLAQRGVTLRFAPMLDPAAVMAAVTPRTRMIAVSAVSFLTAVRYDLPALRQAADQVGALLVVDFTQGAGWMPIRADVADFAFSSTYKWVLGCTGVAIGFWNRARQPDWAPGTAGWHSIASMGRPDWSQRPALLADAGRFTRGNPSHPGLYVLDGALDYLDRFGAPAIQQHVQALTVAMLGRLAEAGIASTTPADPRRHGASVCVASPHAAAIVAGMERRGVLAWNGRGRVRVSFHGYNGSADMARASDALIDEWRAATT
ncbi:aminotransferase class V-fold PLP-dependent enzyme [Roseomonas terrae]|jgi:cysteine desulfurase/selenocysteine lyase|uniref:Aminotransferase class V-fold PLP-dependent enzyme n=1 Tax=Neoroseomonas terrae TaxID=424799 RepID=A0ABS5EMK4_9PROT|nr:aminotransferase class V-fold PLP-dependent enzyme [Neoroseomonas terrae]MBR0652258.1 aminotransferase class V-fold PLP-dependent enzyme [Neoroseomonas terrae]